MVGVENEDVIVRSALDGLATANGHRLALQDLQEVDGVDITASVILGNTVVHILSVGVVDDDSGCGVGRTVGDVVLPGNQICNFLSYKITLLISDNSQNKTKLTKKELQNIIRRPRENCSFSPVEKTKKISFKHHNKFEPI